MPSVGPRTSDDLDGVMKEGRESCGKFCLDMSSVSWPTSIRHDGLHPVAPSVSKSGNPKQKV